MPDAGRKYLEGFPIFGNGSARDLDAFLAKQFSELAV